MTPADRPAPDRIAYIDGLRGLAILGVIVAHTSSLVGLGGYGRSLADAAGMGVQLFFLISAFTIFLTFERAQATDGAPVRNFLLKRVFRIVPVYWFGILLYTALYGLGSRGWDPAPKPWHFAINALLLNDLHPMASNSVVPGGWSISCEMLFYVTTPLWFAAIRNARAALIFTLASVIVGLVVVAGLAAGLAQPLDAIPQADATRFLYRIFPNQLGCFGLGMLLFFLVREDGALCRLLRAPAANLAWIVAAVALFAAASCHPDLMIRHDLVSTSFFLLAMALAQIPRGLFVNAASRLLGRVSYSAYLVHFLVLNLLCGVLPLPAAPPLAFAVLLSGTLGFTVVLASLGQRLVETPAAGWGKALVARLEARSGPRTRPDYVSVTR